MAAPDVSALVALCNKAHSFGQLGHFARQAENKERALVAAQALGAQDCLMVANLLLDVADHILLGDRPVATADEEQRALAQAVTHFEEACGIVQRRRAAGTLMPGSLRAAEMAWRRQTCEHDLKGQKSLPAAARVSVEERVAQLVGYGAFLHAAALSITVISYAHAGSLSATPQLLHECWDLVAEAVVILAIPQAVRQPSGDFGIFEEGEFVRKMGALVGMPELWAPMDAARERAHDAWHRVLRSGVLEERDINGVIESTKNKNAQSDTAAAAAAAAPGLRTCALAGCGARELHPAHFKSCAACRIPAYCCKEHQTEDWPRHKAACKAARKAAEQTG
jgi:hypothetical protein